MTWGFFVNILSWYFPFPSLWRPLQLLRMYGRDPVVSESGIFSYHMSDPEVRQKGYQLVKLRVINLGQSASPSYY